MNIGEIYIHKKNKSIIQIYSFATPMGRPESENMIIVFRMVKKPNEFGEYGTHPFDSGYGSKEEIEEEYQLLISKKELGNYSDWKEIFELIE